ncbi:ferredoxin-NADP reductase [Paenarthrobacter nicotinovorans]|uniref:FAD-dependent oxidoreductase n=1 Tax=Micrococcaceae TaxID=1268 RepID=UPI000877135D|nr:MULTISPECIES: oxidoreductase [Micrococcaceae]MDR6435881.1 ferredoxin-NADP reductase [Paenarthrobacter nicotinovorans]SCZ50973.1 Ferredoxin-NADP reductase [Arthrobacter sp. UNCCL28]
MIAVKSRVDTWLGRFTMYRLILWVLAVLVVFSMVLNILGWLTFGLPEMLVHLALCLGVTYASNRLLAAVFRVRPHTESSLITGLLLYFLFWPAFGITDMTGVALACVVASVSKYALAFRGRHIFNPAAAGAFVTGLTGLNIATWWAATPAMLWLLVPGVLLVLYRTRKMLMATVFLVVAAGIITVELMSRSMTFGQALWQSFAQRPLLFFVGFMLSEPLTLPPRRWQQLALAGVVGVVFAVPYNFGFIANSPELALLLGNLVAFFLGQRGGVELTFKGARALTPGTTEFRFEPQRPVRFEAGQFMELNLPHSASDGKGRRRVFSITSPPGADELTFGVGTAEPLSTAKRALLALQPGDKLSATAVGGDFLLPHDAGRPVLLMAAGIGITPFLSQLAADAPARDTVVLYLAKSREELAGVEQLEASGATVIARLADGSAPPEFMTDAGAARIDAARLKELVPDIGEREVFVSGSPASVDSLRAAARSAGARRVHVDSFAGY